MAATALAVLTAAGVAQAQDAGKLFLFNWTQYMDPEIIKAFEEEYDVQVVESYFNSNGEMFAKMRAGGDSQYDVVVPSNYFVPRLIETGLIQPLDHEKIPNLDNLLPKFRDPNYDPGNEYTAAYQWGTTGIIYNSDSFPDAPHSWALLLDPQVNPQYPFSLITDGQVALGAACAYQGKPYDCMGEENWTEAAKLILETKSRDNFNGFVDGTPTIQQISRGVSHAGMTYNGDYIFYKSENPDGFKNIEFMLPKEGTELWVDNMAIPANAPNPDMAHKFINFILEAKIGAQLSNYNYYSTPNEAAKPHLDEVLQEPPASPTDEQMERLSFTPSLKGDQLKLTQQLWTEVQSR